MNVAHIEALTARKRKGYHSQANVKPVVYSSTYRANVRAAGIRNVWLFTAEYDIYMKVVHIPGKQNSTAYLLTGW